MDTMTSQNSSWPALIEWVWASVLLISYVSDTTVTKPALNKPWDFCYVSVIFFPLDPDVSVGKCFDRCLQVVLWPQNVFGILSTVDV